MSKTIFLVCYGAGHINIIEPIVDHILADGNYQVKLLALTTAYHKVKHKYSKSVLKKVSDYLFLFDSNIDEVFRNGLKLFNENYNPNSGLDKLEILSYLGLSFTDEVSKFGYNTAYKHYSEIGRKSFLPVQTMKEILKYEKPDLLISTTSPRFELASFTSARELNIKSIQILDLFDDGVNTPIADFTVVMNQLIKNNLIGKGFRDDEVLAFGQPSIEKSVNSIIEIDKDSVLSKVEIDLSKPNLVYFSQPPLKFNKNGSYESVGYDFVNPNIFEIFNSLQKDYNLLLRIHPNEDFENYRDYFDYYDKIQFINDKLNLHESIHLADVVVTSYSTVCIEAICCNKNVFTFKPDYSDYYPVEVFKHKPFIYSNSFKDLKVQLLSSNSTLYEKNDVNFCDLGFINSIHQFINKLCLGVE